MPCKNYPELSITSYRCLKQHARLHCQTVKLLFTKLRRAFKITKTTSGGYVICMYDPTCSVLNTFLEPLFTTYLK